MSQFRRLLGRGLDELEARLTESGGSTDADELTHLVGALNFPGLVALLGASETAGAPDADAELDEVAASVAGRMSKPDVSTDRIRSILTNTLQRGEPQVGEDDDRGLRDDILEQAVEELASRAGVPVTPEQARKAAELLATGEFFRDVGEATAAVMFLVRGLPVALRSDMHGAWRTGRVVVAIVKDVGRGVFDVPAILADLRDGKLDDPPVILGHTFRALYGFASLRTTAETIQELIKPENESVRLAIVVYARANGIPLEDGDLDVVRETVFNPDAPDLGPALTRGVERLARDRDMGDIKVILARMSTAPVHRAWHARLQLLLG
ncbi:MAG: hypothetical protein JRH16_09190 [Deltaproteobacteria bacterium]|nr:hypothetical protein [Deltaproteobacteria bacterium]MBW2361929.1 hypothetical protein [Deltaproteobacteria bacterium]